MKLAVIVLVMLGIVAAGAATILVQALPALKQKETPKVDVLVAASDMPARTRLTEEDVMVEQVPATNLPQGFFMAPAQAIGKVLKLDVAKGEMLTAGSCIAKGSIDDLLRPGFLAFPAPLPRRTTSVELLYPGCIVDVFATFPLRDKEKGDAVVTPLLQSIQVLAIGSDTVIPPANEKEAAEQTARRRTGSTANVTVTLEVTARQAAALQLAMEKGNLGLAMRSPTDMGVNPMEPMIVKEGQLTAGSEALDPQTLALVTSLQRILNPEAVPDPNALQPPAAATATVRPDPNNLFNAPPLPAPTQIPGIAPKKSTVEITVIRGQKVEETEVERNEEEQAENEESLQEVGG